MQKSFIETQFPISKLSKESYKERKAVAGQTLTGLGKWWGRKPLILARATIIGPLLPASADPKKSREIFLKILTMGEEGLLKRKTKSISLKELYSRATPREKKEWFSAESTEEKPKYKKGLNAEQKEAIQKTVFMRMSYDEKLTYCDRPEQIDGPSEKAWDEINEHLRTKATNIVELVQELGIRRFGHIPKVGDAFCGGGSIPFEAARIGCEAYGSDLNPVGALLTWASLNIIGGGPEVAKQVQKAQKKVYDAVDKQITEWGIEHNEKGWRADAYLYCNEIICPECGWKVPLAPSWVIGEKTKCVAKLVPNPENKCFDIEIESGVSDDAMKEAKKAGTVVDSYLACPNQKCQQKTPISVIRGDRGGEYGLRMWENDDIVPRSDDVFQERLYCIRWVETYLDDDGKVHTNRYYMAPNKNDLKREDHVFELIKERFKKWQEKGFVPSRKIESGDETTRLMRERGWPHWHHLFNPRQLLTSGLFAETIFARNDNLQRKIGLMLGIGRILNWNSKLSTWSAASASEKTEQTFLNQAFNTLSNYGTRALSAIKINFQIDIDANLLPDLNSVKADDVRHNKQIVDIWITDPPYADAVNYHELSEFFLAWYEKHLTNLFPEWYADSKRALAVVGSDENFRKSMVDCYSNLDRHMPDDGMQIVMFTHQNASVWADLALILWASGLRVTAAWCIGTETSSGLKEGNYVQGTVLLILRKQTSEETAFLDEIYSQVDLSFLFW